MGTKEEEFMDRLLNDTHRTASYEDNKIKREILLEKPNKKNIFRNFINKYKIKKEKKKSVKEYHKTRKEMIQNGIHSELMIDRPDGRDRCSLIITSYDTPQLKELQLMLRNRGINSELLEDFKGGKTLYKFDLMPKENLSFLDIVKDFDETLDFLERYYMYGQPVKDIDFFTKEEKELLKKWYKIMQV